MKKEVGKELGVTDWLQIDQERINQFADCTLDHQWIHVDQEASAKGPFGKTSLVIQTIRKLKEKLRIGIMEADIDSMVDAEKVAGEGVAAIQIRTGGFCHMDAAMVKAGLDEMDIQNLDLVILENVGNLVCPAEFETGATKNAMILSVPEGDDKPLKYPLMFSVCHALVINKTDYLELSDFDVKKI